MHPRFKDFIEWASKNYELVIIDTPPILAVTDAAIGRYSGTNLLVARCEVNTAKELEVSLKRFEQNGVTIRGCILNGIVKKQVAIIVTAIPTTITRIQIRINDISLKVRSMTFTLFTRLFCKFF
jgi:cellulose biosynthesis protein BcsQ